MGTSAGTAGATFGWPTPPWSARSETAARSLSGGPYRDLSADAREAYIDGWWSAARKAAGSSWKSSRQPLPQNQ